VRGAGNGATEQVPKDFTFLPTTVNVQVRDAERTLQLYFTVLVICVDSKASAHAAPRSVANSIKYWLSTLGSDQGSEGHRRQGTSRQTSLSNMLKQVSFAISPRGGSRCVECNATERP
jgi:hypothetical protein